MAKRSYLKSFLVIFAALVVAACGGGGGEGGEGGNNVVSLVNLQPTSINLTAFTGENTEDSPIPTARIVASIAGDVATLDGATVYVYVEAPDAIFTQPTIGFNTVEAVLQMGLIAGLDVGTYSNTMKVSVCLDLQCSKHLGNSPFNIPYTVVVKPGLQVSQQTVNITRIFGSQPEPIIVQAQAAEGGTLEVVSVHGDRPYILSVAVAEDSSSFSITPAILEPGVYTDTFKVVSYITDTNPPVPGMGTQIVQEKLVDFTYTVTANPDIVVMQSPASSTITMSSSESFKELTVGFYSQGVQYSVNSMLSYGSQPDAAVGHAQSNNWLSADLSVNNRFYINVCSINGGPCLPPGTYHATLTFSINDGAQILQHPVTMTITP